MLQRRQRHICFAAVSIGEMQQIVEDVALVQYMRSTKEGSSGHVGSSTNSTDDRTGLVLGGMDGTYLYACERVCQNCSFRSTTSESGTVRSVLPPCVETSSSLQHQSDWNCLVGRWQIPVLGA